jgi:hypothetical protein
VFERAIRNASPIVEVKARKYWWFNLPSSVELVDSEQQTYLRWIIRYADQRVGRSMSIKLANEIIDTANDIGNTIKKRKKLIKMAEGTKLSRILDISFKLDKKNNNHCRRTIPRYFNFLVKKLSALCTTFTIKKTALDFAKKFEVRGKKILLEILLFHSQ